MRRGRETLVEDVSLSLCCGQLTALIGSNGAGKTTLIRALLGEIPYQGRLSYLDHEGKPMRRPRIGYVPQQLDFDRSIPMTAVSYTHLDVYKRQGIRRPFPSHEPPVHPEK